MPGGSECHLVGRVKEGEQALLLDSPQDALPLLRSGVHARGIVGACMQQHNGPLWRPPQVLNHALHSTLATCSFIQNVPSMLISSCTLCRQCYQHLWHSGV